MSESISLQVARYRPDKDRAPAFWEYDVPLREDWIELALRQPLQREVQPEDGRIRPRSYLVGHRGSGPAPRQKEPHPHWVGTDPQNLPAEPLPEGVLALPYAPHGSLFPRAQAIIHQGGIGTTAQALRAGRPMLVVPHAYDQPDNASRVVKLGAARTLSPKHYAATRVATELQDLLAEPSYARRAAEVGRMVQAEAGDQQACDAIEAYLALR
jgi:hypothetical protein